MSERKCTHPGCDRPHFAKGHCRLHYNRAKRGIDMDARIPLRPKITAKIVQRIRELRPTHTDVQIAEKLGLSRNTVGDIRKKYKIGFVPKCARAASDPLVPPWVPQDLVAEFQERCKSSNEFEAASWARAMKRAKAFTRESVT